MKIKTKKTMNLPQLIEHIWANNLRHKWKDSDNTSAYVQVYDDGQLVVDKCTKDSVFTVEVEEEITEDTELNEIFLITNNSICSERYYNYSINDVLSDNEGYYEELAMLIMQPEPIIIWTHDKGLVE
ncbi:hypothetical protein [Staphylococcus sp. GDY8P83P]|uniref:hypothetical protein n=1 Tax=Staphylococcus sp. GDY8P83P TaxID=2804137 RepID=UPI001AEBE209|nr:hypothetical protein [Staphylococcus sp. GDY8P83P]